jgi:hypothetical protein
MKLCALIVSVSVFVPPVIVSAGELDAASHHHCLSQLRRGVPQSAECKAAGYGSSTPAPATIGAPPSDSRKPKK